MSTTPRKDLPGTNAPNWSQRVTEELRVLMGRGGNGRALTAKDLIDSGIAKPGAGGGLVPGNPGSGDSEPDLTPPPVPTGFAVTAGLTTVFVEHDAPVYSQGHGHDRTVVYGVLQTGSTAPTFDQAVVLFQFQGTIGAYPAALGTRYRLWIKWQSKDGVQSASPAGGTNGLDVQTGKIGNNDLGPLIVEAGNLANGSVSASKLAAQAVDATKFAAGIEPVSVSTAGTLPTVKTTSTIVWQSKLYRWDTATGKYTSAVPTVDLTGQIASAQLADNAVTVAKIAAGAVDVGKLASSAVTADKIAAAAIDATKFASGIEPVGIVSGGSLPTVKTTSTIVFGGKLYRWDTATGKYTAAVDSVDLAGQINSAQLADNAVTVAKIAAGAVDAGKLASNAVTADKIAASAVDATKFASGIEPVGIVSGATLPTVKTTSTIVFGGKLYRWDTATGKYTAATAAADVTGQLTDAQLAAISAAKLTGQITGTQITDGAISTPKIAAGAVSASQIAAGAVTAGKIAANAVSATEIAAGAVTVGKIAANAVTANEIAANAVTTAKIAAGAVTAAEVAANAITASKLAISDTTNLIPDQDFNDPAAWTAAAVGWNLEVSPPDMRSANAARFKYTAGTTGYSSPMVCKRFAVEAGREYTMGLQSKPTAATSTYRYWYRAHFYDANGTIIQTGTGDYISIFVGTVTVTADPVTNVSIQMVAPAAAVAAEVRIYVDRTATSVDILFAGLYARMAARGELIVDGAITATKIAAKAITAAQIAAGAISATELAAGAVTAGKIAAGSITATELAANSVTALQLAANAVTAGKVAANAVTAGTIAANAVTTATIAAGAVTAAEIAAGAVLTSKLVVSDTSTLVPDSEYQDIDMWFGDSGGTVQFKLNEPNALAGTVSKSVLQINRVNTGTTSFDGGRSSRFAVTPNTDYVLRVNIYSPGASTVIVRVVTLTPADVSRSTDLNLTYPSGSWGVHELKVRTSATESRAQVYIYIREDSTAAFLYVGKMRFNEAAAGSLIVDGAITATKIAAKAITAAQIAAGTITTAELGANSVTTAQIAAGAVTANEIATNAITAVKIAAGAVTAGKIAANAVTANEIAANAVTTAQIAAGAVTATEIAAGSITASKLAITATDTVNLDPFFQDTGMWAATGFTRKAGSEGSPGPFVVSATTNVNTVFAGSRTPIDPTRTYLFETWFKALATTTNRAFAVVVFYDVNGTLLVDADAPVTGWPGVNTGQGRGYFPGTVTVTQLDWTRHTLTVGPEGVAKIPAKAAYFAVGVFLNYNGAAPIVESQWGGLRVTEMSRGELIVDGAITAAKIAAKAITAAQIAAGTITTAELGANSVTTAQIAAGAVTANEIATNAITAVKIAAGAVTAGKIAANAVTANEIAANSITTAKIATGAVNADQIAANAILASKLVISDQSNMLADTEFRDMTYWRTDNAATSTDAAAVAALSCTPVLANVAGATANFELYQRSSAYYVSVEPGRTYRLSIQVYIAAGWNGRVNLNLQGYASNGTTGTNGANNAGTDYRTTPAASATTATITVDYTASATTSFARFRVNAQFSSAAVEGLFIGRPRMWLKQDADLIVDGAIVATKIAAGAIAVGTAAIQNGAIVNAMIGNAAIDNAKIAVAAIDSAKIANGAIQNANIANGAIDNAKIANLSATKITGGAMQVGSFINSSNYISGSQGWSINANGQAEFSGVIVRGTLYSSAGTIGGITINANGLNAGGYWGYAWPPAGQSGFHLGPVGLLLGNYNNGRWIELNANGNISAPGFAITDGTSRFWGNLEGASGTFNGTLTAQNVVVTGNLQANAVTHPMFAQSGSGDATVWTIAFDGSMFCSVTYGASGYTSATSDMYIRLYIDGVMVQQIRISPGGDANTPRIASGTYCFGFSGNGNGRVITASSNFGSQNGSFVQATIFKR